MCILFWEVQHFGNSRFISMHYVFLGNAALGNSLDWLQNLDSLKESVRLASSTKWDELDLSQFQGKDTIQGKCDQCPVGGSTTTWGLKFVNLRHTHVLFLSCIFDLSLVRMANWMY